jgi:hypothetical protein
VSVADRRREFGIRVALGATPRSLAAGVLRQGLLWTGSASSAGRRSRSSRPRFWRACSSTCAPGIPRRSSPRRSSCSR